MMNLYFSEYFEVDANKLDEYGAFNVSVVSDMPLFIDPFLLFNSHKAQYKDLHNQIIKYLKFLRDKTAENPDVHLIKNLYCFKEIKQNWLGFTLFGNDGSGLGMKFATSLNRSLASVLNNFGEEKVTAGTHLEKLALIKKGVGRDNISDFTTNLIKEFLLEYTQTFARRYIDPSKCRDFSVTRARFNYETESWETRHYFLPELRSDFVLLTPSDILTRDETWINKSDMLRSFRNLPLAVDDDELRAQVNNYLWKRLSEKTSEKQKKAVAEGMFQEFPELIDYYIKSKEVRAGQAKAFSSRKVDNLHEMLVSRLKSIVFDLESKTDFYQKPWTSLEESLDRVMLFKNYIENQDGYKLINRKGKGFSNEDDVQIFFGLIWCRTDFDINREPNNGRGPVDFKVSFGAGDKSLIEFKLASNSQLKRNLQKQVEIYERANKTTHSVKAIICYTAQDQKKVEKILIDLNMLSDPYVVTIDARNDNKPSASKA